MFELPIEILQYITDYLDTYSQLNFMRTCHYIQKAIRITNLDVSYRDSSKLTIEILNQYPYITKLNLYGNLTINDLSNFRYIKQLNISTAKITQNGINQLLNIIELNISNNTNLFDITIFKNLEIIKINGMCNIILEDLRKLSKLKKIYALFNPRLKQIEELQLQNITVISDYIVK